MLVWGRHSLNCATFISNFNLLVDGSTFIKIMEDKNIIAQVKQDFSKDLKNIILYLKDKGTERFRRDVLKAAKYPYFPMPTYYTTSNGHKYMIIAIARKRSSWKNLEYYFARIINNKVYSFDSYENNIVIYPLHVFVRYRERFLKDTNIPISDVIKIFFKRNPIFLYKGRVDRTYMASCGDGVVFGIVKDGYRVVKTFISTDMQFEKQKRLSVFLEKLRLEWWKELA